MAMGGSKLSRHARGKWPHPLQITFELLQCKKIRGAVVVACATTLATNLEVECGRVVDVLSLCSSSG